MKIHKHPHNLIIMWLLLFLLPLCTAITFLPSKCLGVWCLATTNDPRVPVGAELFVDYTRVELLMPRAVGPVRLAHTFHGQLFVSDSALNVVWLKVTDVEIDVGLFPRLQLPYPSTLCRMRITQSTDPTGCFLDIQTKEHSYLFCKSVARRTKSDTIAKIFITQLVFDFVIRQLHH